MSHLPDSAAETCGFPALWERDVPNSWEDARVRSTRAWH